MKVVFTQNPIRQYVFIIELHVTSRRAADETTVPLANIGDEPRDAEEDNSA